MYGALSADGKHQFRQDDKFDKVFHCIYGKSRKEIFRIFRQSNSNQVKGGGGVLLTEYRKDKYRVFSVGSVLLDSVKKCWRQFKGNTLSNYYSSFSQVKQTISNYYSTRRFELDVK